MNQIIISAKAKVDEAIIEALQFPPDLPPGLPQQQWYQAWYDRIILAMCYGKK
jgi:hypothetical protein